MQPISIRICRPRGARKTEYKNITVMLLLHSGQTIDYLYAGRIDINKSYNRIFTWASFAALSPPFACNGNTRQY